MVEENGAYMIPDMVRDIGPYNDMLDIEYVYLVYGSFRREFGEPILLNFIDSLTE